LGGFQGLLGWYMVKSGLDKETFSKENSLPRVSQYWLAAHLTSAIVLYTGLFSSALNFLSPIAKLNLPQSRELIYFRGTSLGTTALILCTMLSGAFVAGLDAGLVYNTFPLMAGQIVPEGLLELHPRWRNFFENVTTVQFDHRVLGIASVSAVSALFLYSLGSKTLKLTRTAKMACHSLFAMALLQVTLGISTLLTYVPVPLAASHQAGALTLYTIALWFLRELKRIR